MKKLSFGFILILANYSLYAQQPESKTPATMPTVHAANGDLRGLTEGDVSSFKGVPYAAAPIGEYRWRPPQSFPAWKGERDATNLRSRNGSIIAPKDQEVAKMVKSYWVNFAKTGDPNGNGLAKWPVYDPKKNEILEFKADGSAAGEPDPRKARLDIIEKAVTSGNLH